jgi:hypothetical protein
MTTLICPAVYAVTMLASMGCCQLGGQYELGRIRVLTTVPIDDEADVVAARWFCHAWLGKSGT